MATLSNFEIPGIKVGMSHPKLKNLYRMTFNGLGGAADARPLSAQIISSDRPKLTFNEKEIHRYNAIGYVQGKHRWEPLNFSMEDEIGGRANGLLQQQLELQKKLTAPTSGDYLAPAVEGSLMKFSTRLDIMDGGDVVLESWIMEGCWFSNIDYGDVSYQSDDIVVINLVMRYDHARQVIQGFRSDDANGSSALGGHGVLPEV